MPHLSDHLSLVSPCGSALVNGGTARVTRLGKTPRSYEVTLTDGRKFRRNRRQLRPSAPAHADRYENNDDHEAPAIQPDFGQGTEVETQQPFTTRAGRVVRPPRWMDNYVH